tara:strand:+ start:131 stop:487 length:357 start_codon:yes stop_codon:yes gene_type:complete
MKRLFLFSLIFLFNFNVSANSVQYNCKNLQGAQITNNKIIPIPYFEFTFYKNENVLLFDDRFILPKHNIFLTKLEDEYFSGSASSDNGEIWKYDNGNYIYSVGITGNVVMSLIGQCTK